MRGAPFWPGLEALAHTLPYEGRIMGYDGPDRSLPVERWQAIEVRCSRWSGTRARTGSRTWCAPWPGRFPQPRSARSRGRPTRSTGGGGAVLREFFLG